MVLVSRTRSRADEIVTLDNVNKFIDPSSRVSINNLAMFSKKSILEVSVYLLGDEMRRLTKKNFWRFVKSQ